MHTVEHMAEPKYHSWTKAENAKRKRLERQREAELLQRVNKQLAALNIDWKQLMRLIENDEVIITVREKAK